MESDEVVVRLKILSLSRSPEKIAELIGLQPDKWWRAGEMRGRSSIRESNNGWELHSGLPRATPLEMQIEKLLSRVLAHSTQIKTLSVVDTVELSIAIYSASMSAPALAFGKEVIDSLGLLGAGMDIDLYLLGE